MDSIDRFDFQSCFSDAKYRNSTNQSAAYKRVRLSSMSWQIWPPITGVVDGLAQTRAVFWCSDQMEIITEHFIKQVVTVSCKVKHSNFEIHCWNRNEVAFGTWKWKFGRQMTADVLEPRAPGHQRHNFIFKLFTNNHSIVIKRKNNLKPAAVCWVTHEKCRQAWTNAVNAQQDKRMLLLTEIIRSDIPEIIHC